MTVYIAPNLQKEKAAEVSILAGTILQQHGVTVLFCTENAFLCEGQLFTVLPLAECYEQADILLTIGGDGTILHEASCSLAYHKPILGVNLGRCGFLATCEQTELSEKLALVAKGAYALDTRGLLFAQVEQAPHIASHALNDIVIGKRDLQQTIDCSIYCDDILVETYRCDGLILATPTGSTAYSLAAGGPILDSQTKGTVLTPICPHSLHSPSMVFAPERKLRVKIADQQRGEVLLSCDGSEGHLLHPGQSVEIHVSKKTVELITFSKADQFHAIDRKLK